MKIIIIIGVLLVGIVIGFIICEQTLGDARKKAIIKLEDFRKKNAEFYSIQNRWIKILHEGRGTINYFEKNGYKTVAIYGMKELGILLLEELNNSGVEVKYAIDRDADKLYVATDVYKPDEDLQKVDVVVVTAIHYFDSIKAELEKKMDCPIISLEDVIWES
ncbi:hypothetical protein [Butyrivibrio proteoclasticus]|uniref:hypothetical protein n=1 Tax=Butyrivibrio proteoclasticus TaxID=43305 RepID=UPI00047A3C22|nr:hypothetical protein [Butyrivibrio proteoclasticus]